MQCVTWVAADEFLRRSECACFTPVPLSTLLALSHLSAPQCLLAAPGGVKLLRSLSFSSSLVSPEARGLWSEELCPTSTVRMLVHGLFGQGWWSWGWRGRYPYTHEYEWYMLIFLIKSLPHLHFQKVININISTYIFIFCKFLELGIWLWKSTHLQ